MIGLMVFMVFIGWQVRPGGIKYHWLYYIFKRKELFVCFMIDGGRDLVSLVPEMIKAKREKQMH
jgi:hypothetical protein